MLYIKKIFWTIWRIWFFLMMGIIIIIMGPLLFITSLKEKWYPYFFVFARIWGKGTLITSGFYYTVERETKLEKGKSYMFVANHTSITDILLMLAVVKKTICFCWKSRIS